jgi:tetratricopeptide (TPR) repeat protein
MTIHLRRLFILLLWCVVLSPSAAVAQSDAEHQQFLFAYKLLQRGEVAEAASEFDEYLGKFPRGEKFGDAQYYRALLYRKAGQNERAAKLLADAKEPTIVPAYALKLLHGQVLSDQGKFKEALGPLEQIDTDELDDKIAVSALYLKGLAYRGAENMEAAATALADAAQLDTPMKARALLDLAKVRALMKDNVKALAALERCLQIEDAKITPEAARFAGDLSYNAGEFGKAIGYYNTVASRYQSSTHFAPAVVGLLWAQFADERYDDLRKTFDNSIDALPVSDRLPAYYLAGSAYQEQENHAKAAELLAQVSGGSGSLPIQEKVLYKLALSQFELERYDAMSDTIGSLKRRFPETKLAVDVAFLQATADADAGQVLRGASRLTQFVDEGPSSPYYQQALLRRAHLYETNGQIEPAAKDYEAYLRSVQQTDATSLQAGFRLMELLGALAEHDRVIALATSALELQDDGLRTPEVEQEALYRLAVAQRFNGDLDKALATHSRLTREHPINPYRAESVLEQGLIRMTQGDTERGIPLLLDAVERENLNKASKISALRIVAQYKADSGAIGEAFDLRMKMQTLAGDEVFRDDERLWLGETLLNRRKPKEAMAYLAEVQSDATRERALLLTGRAQRMAGDYDAAIATLNEVRAISERFGTEAWLQLALTYRDMGKPDEALAELIPLQNPDRGHRIASQALYEAGVLHQRLYAFTNQSTEPDKAASHLKSAREAFKKLWLLYPDREGEDVSKRAYLELALLEGLSGDAVREVKTLLELEKAYPESAYATFAKALLAIRADQPERADRYLRQTVEQAKGNENIDLTTRAEDLLRRDR